MSEVGHDSFVSKINSFLNDSEIDIKNKSMDKSLDAGDRSPLHIYDDDFGEGEDEIKTLKKKNEQLIKEKEEMMNVRQVEKTLN